MLSVGGVANPHWSTWLGYGTFTPVDRVRFPDAELFIFLLFYISYSFLIFKLLLFYNKKSLNFCQI